MRGPRSLLAVAASHPTGHTLVLHLLRTLVGEHRRRVAAAVTEARELLLTTAGGRRVVAAV